MSLLQGSTTPPTPDAAPPGDPLPPHLRGWLHLVCFFLSVPAGVLVVVSAGSGRGRLAALVYAFGMTAMFGVSAAYHRGRWSPTARRRMRRTDHGTIFLMIAGSYTPLCLLTLRGTTGTAVLAAVWAGAAVGFLLALTGVAEKAVLGLLAYIGLGWAVVVALPELTHRLSTDEMTLLVAGGVVYTLGGVVLGAKRPNPSARWFGYHEVWHAMVVVACACHYLTILSVVGAAP
ncbi:MAG TPA: hemolysin III family protein [Acidimicrobiales bacterium]|nr:hemolysin III family protein [Acidimicrobiales bacterium]